MAGVTENPMDPRLTHGCDTEPVPQAAVYLVLSEEERAKGFVRPVRREYKHVGLAPKYELRPLTSEEVERVGQYGYVLFEPYPESELPVTGKFWTQAELTNRGCGAVTSMGTALAETYARSPRFYGSTYCVGCKKHRPIAEFVWEPDGQTVGS